MAAPNGTPAANFFANDASPDLNLTVPNVARRIIALYMGCFDASALTVNLPTFSLGGTFVQFVTNGSVTAGLQRVYYMINPPDGAGTITITYSSTMDETVLAAACYTDVNQTTPMTDGQSASNATGTSTTAITASLSAGDAIFAGTYFYGGANTTSTPSDSLLAENEPGAADRSGVCSQNSTDGSCNFTFNNSSFWMTAGARIVNDSGAAATWGPLIGLRNNRLVNGGALFKRASRRIFLPTFVLPESRILVRA